MLAEDGDGNQKLSEPPYRSEVMPVDEASEPSGFILNGRRSVEAKEQVRGEQWIIIISTD